ncbi:MBL fold metallo-hydrolase [Neomicrococcus lactis]
MLLERIYEEGLAQASYLVGCQRQGKALVVDPRRDIQVYLDLAAKHGLTITHVTETHIHADFLSGSRELAAATGAELLVSGEGGADWQYGFDATRLMHQDTFALGNITVQALHTPGHTPEHLSYLITDGAVTDQPGYLLSGDFVFAGDVGRPDLLDEAAGGVDTRFGGAQALFQSLKNVFLALPDHVQVHPGHGAGSPCGKALGAIPSSTVGYERLYAWWAPFMKDDDAAAFTDALLAGQPDAHAYFARMKRQNKQGPAILGELAEMRELTDSQVTDELAADQAIFIDTRSQAEVHEGTVVGSLNVPAGNSASNYAAWVIDPDEEDRDLIVLAPSQVAAETFRDALLRVGIDGANAWTTSIDGLEQYIPEMITPEEFIEARESGDGELAELPLIDVRSKNEFAEGTIPGAQQLSGGSAMWRLDELPAKRVITFCQSGVRNSVVASGLRRAGYSVVELEGSYAGWFAAQQRNQQRTPQHA